MSNFAWWHVCATGSGVLLLFGINVPHNALRPNRGCGAGASPDMVGVLKRDPFYIPNFYLNMGT